MCGLFLSAIIGSTFAPRRDDIVVTRLAHTQPDDGKHPRLSSVNTQKRVLPVAILVSCALMLSICFFYQSTYRGSTDWHGFWVGDVIVGVCIFLRIVLIIRRYRGSTERPKLSMTDDPITAHKWAVRNRSDLQKSNLCGCFYCLAVFPANEVQNWIDDGETALCPKCGIDSVIGSISEYPIQHEFLSKMHDHWF
jgi:hypothetical protein